MKGNEIESFLNNSLNNVEEFIDFVNDISMKLFYLINNVFTQPRIAPEVNSSSILLTKFSFAFLLLSMLFYWFQTTFKFTRQKFLNNLPSLAMWLANITLALMLTLRWIESGHFPLSNLYESLLFLSWSLTSIHLFLERALTKGGVIGSTIMLGAITSPLALFTNAFATFSLPQEMQKVTVLVPALQSNWLIMHVSVMMISYAALLSGSLLAIAFLVVRFAGARKDNFYSFNFFPSEKRKTNKFDELLEEDLRTKFVAISQTWRHWSTENSLTASYFSEQKKERIRRPIKIVHPKVSDVTGLSIESLDYANSSTVPLFLQERGKEVGFRSSASIDLGDILDNLSYRSIGLGFAFLTIGIFSGAVWANEAWGSYWSWDPKETWAFITWLVFALYLHTRLSRGWVGKESALVATFGFLVIWFCYLGVNLFGKGLHSYGWFPSI